MTECGAGAHAERAGPDDMDTANGGHDYTYRSYPQRWRVLAIIFALNVLVQVRAPSPAR